MATIDASSAASSARERKKRARRVEGAAMDAMRARDIAKRWLIRARRGRRGRRRRRGERACWTRARRRDFRRRKSGARC